MHPSHADVIRAATIPDNEGLYFVGPFNRRITFYSQQVRSLRLAHALHALGSVGQRQRTAVVGSGAAGATMAVGLGLLGHEVTLYDAASDILQLQSASSRLLHPHIYEWPRLGSLDDRAGLPVLDWVAADAGAVCRAIRVEFAKAKAALPNLAWKPGVRLTSVVRFGASWRLSLDGPEGLEDQVYEHVVLAIGFGEERSCGMSVPEDYWRPGAIGTPATEGQAGATYLVSGNGDGALTELLALLVTDFEHVAFTRQFLSFFNGDELRSAAVQTFGGASHGEDVEQRLIDGLLPTLRLFGAVDRLRRVLRSDRVVTINSNGPLFAFGKAAQLNQCMAFALLEAARLESVDVRRTSGHVSDVSGRHGSLTTSGIGLTNGPFKHVKLRHGPDIEARYGAIGPLLAAYKAHIQLLLDSSPELAAPPALANDTYEFFEASRIDKLADFASRARERQRATDDRNVIEIGVDDATHTLVEKGVRTLKEVAGECERLASRVTIDLHVEPRRLPAATRLVRLATCSGGRIEIRAGRGHEAAWRELLPRIVEAPFPSSVRTARDFDATGLDALLDLRLLRAIDGRVRHAIAHGEATPLGTISWAILDQVATTWESWRATLEASEGLRFDVLRWLANVDQTRPTPWDGDPASIQRMANAMIMTMAVHGAKPMSPRSVDRGNFTFDGDAVALGSGCEAIGAQPLSHRTDPRDWGVDALILSAAGDLELDEPPGRVLDGGLIGYTLTTAKRVSPAIVQNNRRWRDRLAGDLATWTTAVLDEFARLRDRQDADLRGVSG